MLVVISRSLVLGRRGASMTVLGNEIGVYVQILAGCARSRRDRGRLCTLVELAGAAYVGYLGVQAAGTARDWFTRSPEATSLLSAAVAVC